MAVLVVGMAAACALLLAVPGQTVATKYLNDIFIFLDGAHRVASGQVPNRDFHTALGPLAFYMPAIGLLLTGSLGAAMPVGTAVLILLFAPVMAHILGSRLRPAIALPLAAFLLLILAVPMNLGESVTALSFGMFYNRIGWSALALLLVMYAGPPRTGAGQTVADALCAASLVLLMLYMKISYGVVGLAFLGFMLLVSPQRRWAALALAIVLAGGLMIEAIWRSSAAYVSDVLLAGEVSGGLRGGIEDLANAFLRNLADYVLFALTVGLGLWRTRSFRDLLFYGFCAVGGFLIINQNFQNWGIITLAAGAAVAAESLARSEPLSTAEPRWPMASGVPLLLLAFVLPTIVHCGMALGLHAAVASTRPVQSLPGLPKFDRIKLADLWTSGDYQFFAKYLSTLQEGSLALAAMGEKPTHVLVLDFVSPFSAGMGLEPPRGDSPWHHYERTFDKVHFLAPEKLFADVRVVMEPKWSVDASTTEGLAQVYGPYLAANFDVVRETESWKVHVARHWAPGQPIRSVQAAPDKIGPGALPALSAATK